MQTITFIICWLLISIFIVHSSELDHLGEDITSNILSGMNTIELIKMYYGKQPMLFPIGKVAEELEQRMQTLDQNEFDENVLILLEMYHQSVDDKIIPPYASDKVSEIVRTELQAGIDEVCGFGARNMYTCDLSSTGPNAGLISNDLLQALDHFGRNILVPSRVMNLYLGGLGLTSLWLKIQPGSELSCLSLENNNFVELNEETFGRFSNTHPWAPSKLKTLSLRANVHLTEIDFDELRLPHIEFLGVSDCPIIQHVQNIPRSMLQLSFEHSGIRDATQLRFKSDTGNALYRIKCTPDCRQEFEDFAARLRPQSKVKAELYCRDILDTYSWIEIRF